MVVCALGEQERDTISVEISSQPATKNSLLLEKSHNGL